ETAGAASAAGTAIADQGIPARTPGGDGARSAVPAVAEQCISTCTASLRGAGTTVPAIAEQPAVRAG
ncbi:hypothetical protein, partial [Mycobacterium tuberculosis]